MRLALACVLLSGCYTTTLYAPAAATPRGESATERSIELEVIREHESGRQFETDFLAMERTLRRELPRAHGFRPVMQGDVRIELRLNALEVRTHNARSRTAVLAMCAIVLLLPACAFIGATPRDVRELHTQWTIEVFGADQTSLLREDFATLSEAGIGRMTPGEMRAFEAEMAQDTARKLIAKSLDEVRRALMLLD